MSQPHPVPRLDLAPKLKRPLSLWNPLDYLRLLYWVFFFPQALRWYVDTFAQRVNSVRVYTYTLEEGVSFDRVKTLLKGWKWLHQNPVQSQLILQELILTVVTPLILGVLLQHIEVPVYWPSIWLGVAGGIVGIALSFLALVNEFLSDSPIKDSGVISWGAGGILFGMMMCVASGGLSDLSNIKNSMVLGITFGIVVGATRSVIAGVAGNKGNYAIGFHINYWIVLAFFLSVALYTGVAFIPATVGVLTFFVADNIASKRPDNWIFGFLLTRLKPRNGCWWPPHITPLPIPISSQVKNWLRYDWEAGLHNADQLLTYTLQFSPVIHAVNWVLAETPSGQVFIRIAQLAQAPYSWILQNLVSAAPAVVGFQLLNCAAGNIPPYYIPDEYTIPKADLEEAIKAFAQVRSLPHGEEMFRLAQNLSALYNACEPDTIANIKVASPPQKSLLRSATWEAITFLKGVAKEVQAVKYSVSHSARSYALNRALGELTKFIEKTDTLPQPEADLVRGTTQVWRAVLLQIAEDIGEISITKPVTNPYVVGDPVEGNLFVGREDVLRQLEEFWVMGHQLQSVVLYGHRRMGKTSILLNAANCSGSGVKVAYVNLLRLGDSPQGVGEVLMAISDAISEAVGGTPPTDADLLNLPYRTFERYLKQVEAHLSGGLIVALDEFEKIEELIEAEKIPKDFMGYLRGLVQMSSKVAFAFAGLHTLEEMTADYFQPFFASVIPIHVGFLQPGATRQILANPDEDFPLDYTPEALDQIYALTAGQPYLVQLVGFQLVRRYNDYVFEQGRPRNPVFTVEDVEAVINDPEFFKRGRYYFDGVWGQAARGASGQQAILTAIAPHQEGLNLHAIALATDIDETTIEQALKTLKRHDVVQETEGYWHIIVELFRRWVLGL